MKSCHRQQETRSDCSGKAPCLTVGSPSWFCIIFVKAYRYCISPLLPPTCRFVPTCSQYAVDAIMRYGALRGVFMTFCRVIRCHPFSRGGYDPVRK